jgi:hypothetical protein
MCTRSRHSVLGLQRLLSGSLERKHFPDILRGYRHLRTPLDCRLLFLKIRDCGFAGCRSVGNTGC